MFTSAPHLIEKTKDQTDTKPRRRNLKRATEFPENRFGGLGTPLKSVPRSGEGSPDGRLELRT